VTNVRFGRPGYNFCSWYTTPRIIAEIVVDDVVVGVVEYSTALVVVVSYVLQWFPKFTSPIRPMFKC